MSVWEKARSVTLRVADSIAPGFNVWFDKRIDPETKKELVSFMRWAQNNYRFPITLWTDFEYKHYLVSKAGKRVGFLFNWADFSEYPVFDEPKALPEIRLPVRTEKYSPEEVLTSFIEAISLYFAWICGERIESYSVDEAEVEKILRSYMDSK